jgi:nicotinamidase-related amidase
MSRPWDALLSEGDRAVYEAAGYGRRGAWGSRPVLLVVDVNYNFAGDRPEPILESIRRFHNSCGEYAWASIPKIAELLGAARRAGVPVFFTTQELRVDALRVGAWGRKNSRAYERDEEAERLGTTIVAELEPKPDELVIRKTKPSAFFGTSLLSYLVQLGVDTVMVAGATTSGCVRATVVDAFSLNFPVVVVEDCVFDRGQASHAINLFDMHSKYADLVPLPEAMEYLSGTSA